MFIAYLKGNRFGGDTIVVGEDDAMASRQTQGLPMAAPHQLFYYDIQYIAMVG